jgi:hypothetical protein
MLRIRQALICEKWTLPILMDDAAAMPSSMKAQALGGYHQFIAGRSRETGLNALGIEWLCGMLPKGGIACEPFGGVGVFATVVQEVIRPKRHLLYDIEPSCLDQLGQAFGDRPGVLVRYGDATVRMGQDPADVHVIDYPFFTMKHYWKWDAHWSLMTANRAKGIIWLDGSIRYLHLNGALYEAEFGRRIEGPEDYARAMSGFLSERHGYEIVAASMSHSCFYFLAMPGETGKFEMRRFGDGRKGFCWID